MSITSLILRQIREVLLGDRFRFGFLRFILLLVIPSLLSLADPRWRLFGAFSLLVQRLTLVYLLGWLSAFAAGVAYIRDIYELDSDRMAFHHLVSSFFGIGIPKINVSNRLQDAFGKEMIEKIGGPARLDIESGYAVLTETLTAPAHIYGPGGKQHLSRQERVYEFIDLHEHDGTIPEVTATTRDGISVTVENIKFIYRLWDSQWASDPPNHDTVLNPYPFSVDAIHNYVYKRTVSVDERGHQNRFSWDGLMRGRVGGIIKDYITEHRLDDVIASREHDQDNSRKTIWKKAFESDFKKGSRSMGTILRWWDPGEFRSLKTIEKQFLSNWSVDIQGYIQVNQAQGDAQKQAYEELGRAEAEAELLMSIVHSLDGINLVPNKPQTLQNLILMRTAQVIHALNTPAKEVQPRKSTEVDLNKKQKV
jgi:hypothetical protein